ncbi:TPA: hypothetical protein ACYSE6_006620 [Pseudomonas aeruginosa]
MYNLPVFIVDTTPARYRHLVQGLAEGLGQDRFYLISLQNFGLFDFKYPHGLTFTALPFVGEPQWKPREWTHPVVYLAARGEYAALEAVTPGDVLADAAEIICACSPDPTGAHAFHVLLSQTLGVQASQAPHRWLPLMSMSQRGIAEAFAADNLTTHDPAWQALLRRAEAKRFFEFNFNVNSLMLFGKALRALGVEAPGFLMSKWMLQVLYWFECDQRHGPFTAGKALLHMEDWSGWVSHAPKPSPGVLGSPASRYQILENLLAVGLLQRDGQGLYSISKLGSDFIVSIHTGCQDMDLPWRLRAWEDAWPESRPKIERYLRTVFGRQKRFRSPLRAKR